MTKRLALAAAALALAAPLVTATPAHAAGGCGAWTIKDNGHTIGIHCDDGPGTQYRSGATFCGPSGCFFAKAATFKDYGEAGKSWVHSDYATVNGDGGLILYR